jgi:hypothetical protein
MGLVDDFNAILQSQPDDWTDLQIDLRIADESRYIEASLYLTTCFAHPYSKYDWHWRLNVAHRFGHGAAPEAVLSALTLLDEAAIDGELALRETRAGRVEVNQWWGRPQSTRETFERTRAQ